MRAFSQSNCLGLNSPRSNERAGEGSRRHRRPIPRPAFALGVLIEALFFLVPVGCATRPPDDSDNTCDPAAPDCTDNLVCNALVSGISECVAPVVVVGQVLDATDDAPIEGALVQAVDVNGAVVAPSAETDADGSFTLTVPVIRDEDGAPREGSFTLRSQAAAYQAFPSPIRPALPIDGSTAAFSEEDDWVIENALTTIKLIPLPGDTSALGSISGTIEAESNSGILVVAESNGTGFTGFSDADGDFTVFNVPAGVYELRGYAAGVQLAAVGTTVSAGEAKTDVNLTESSEPLSTVSGNVQIVNAPGGSLTSVILAVESTFVEDSARGEAPPGLRVGDVSGAFVIEDVPDGRYVVLSAFENDGLVRDPDQNIGGTQIVHLEVPDPTAGNSITISEGFKITGALGVLSPGAEGPEIVSTPNPAFQWQDDSSEDGYEIQVFDAFGNEIWSMEIASVSGSASVTLEYDGPALESGLFYQFRATSFRERSGVRTAISRTEDLKGVFQFLAP